MEKLEKNGFRVDLNNSENLLSPEETRILDMAQVFGNFTKQVLLQRKEGKKGVREMNKKSKVFWEKIDQIIQEQTDKIFFAWFYCQYFEEKLGMREVHRLLVERISPISLQYSVFYKFISSKAFIATRSRSEGQKTPLAQRRLKHRQKPQFTSRQLSQRAQKGWKTRRAKTRKKLTDFTKDLPN